MEATKQPSVTKLYGFGSNGAGQLGVGHQDDLTNPQACFFKYLPETAEPFQNALAKASLHDDTIEKLVAGGNHTVLLTHKGHVYVAGGNIDGRCGTPQHGTLQTFYTVDWAGGRNIADIAATWEASFFVEDARKVWTCGTGNKGELGLGEAVIDSMVPKQVFDVAQVGDSNLSIIKISASMNHVTVLLSDGQLFGWGNCRKGQLGAALRSEKVVWKPQKLELPIRASKVVTGRDFTLCLSQQQDVCLFGAFDFQSEAEKLTSMTGESFLYAGWTSLYRLNQGVLHGVGQGRRGQLPPQYLPNVKSLAAGSEHCVSLLENGQVVAWGWGEHGNCGLPLDDRGNVANRFNTIVVPLSVGETVAGVGAGCASSFVWTTTAS